MATTPAASLRTASIQLHQPSLNPASCSLGKSRTAPPLCWRPYQRHVPPNAGIEPHSVNSCRDRTGSGFGELADEGRKGWVKRKGSRRKRLQGRSFPLCPAAMLSPEPSPLENWSPQRLGVLDAHGEELPTQADAIMSGGSSTSVLTESRPLDVDYLQELLAIQQQGARNIGFFGTRNMGFMHQQLIEILSYAMIITNNHIYTSGASGTNAAVIRGALRAEKPEQLTVILPQSLKMQPVESQELLAKVKNVIDKPHNDHLPLIEASRLCNMDIISHVQQVICFAFHDSKLLMETCREAKSMRKIVTLFYLD